MVEAGSEYLVTFIDVTKKLAFKGSFSSIQDISAGIRYGDIAFLPGCRKSTLLNLIRGGEVEEAVSGNPCMKRSGLR